MREIEDRLVTLGVPYRVIGGPRFYERAEIRDALAYLRCVNQPADDLAFERIINVPKRGLGDATIQLLHNHARAARVPMMEAARFLVETDELKPKPRSTLRDLLISFGRWSKLSETMTQSDVAQTVLEESGYTDMWQRDKSADAAGRLENLKELVRSMEEFPDLQSFLEHVSLVMEANDSDTTERVSLMTMHAAKGLEFDTVFLPGWEEGLLPNQRALDESGRAGLEEERRLAHVGITRAKRRAKIYFASNRRIHGLWNSTIPSRFVDDLPENDVEIVEAPGELLAWGRIWRWLAVRPHAGLQHLVLPDAGMAACAGPKCRPATTAYSSRRPGDRRGPDGDRWRTGRQIRRSPLRLSAKAGACSTPSSAPAPWMPSTATS